MKKIVCIRCLKFTKPKMTERHAWEFHYYKAPLPVCIPCYDRMCSKFGTDDVRKFLDEKTQHIKDSFDSDLHVWVNTPDKVKENTPEF